MAKRQKLVTEPRRSRGPPHRINTREESWNFAGVRRDVAYHHRGEIQRKRGDPRQTEGKQTSEKISKREKKLSKREKTKGSYFWERGGR